MNPPGYMFSFIAWLHNYSPLIWVNDAGELCSLHSAAQLNAMQANGSFDEAVVYVYWIDDLTLMLNWSPFCTERDYAFRSPGVDDELLNLDEIEIP